MSITQEIFTPKPMESAKCVNYLNIIAHSLGQFNGNYGALRKDIWSQMGKLRQFREQINFYDFLVAI